MTRWGSKDGRKCPTSSISVFIGPARRAHMTCSGAPASRPCTGRPLSTASTTSRRLWAERPISTSSLRRWSRSLTLMSPSATPPFRHSTASSRNADRTLASSRYIGHPRRGSLRSGVTSGIGRSCRSSRWSTGRTSSRDRISELSDDDLRRFHEWHHRSIREFFADAENFLILPLDARGLGAALCDFCGLPPLPFRQFDYAMGHDLGRQPDEVQAKVTE